MSEENSDTTASPNAGGPKGPLVSQAIGLAGIVSQQVAGSSSELPGQKPEDVGSRVTEDQGELPARPVNEGKKPSVKYLEPLPEEILDTALKVKAVVGQRNLTSASEGAFKPGIYWEDGKAYWVLPLSIFEGEDNYLGAMIVDFAQAAGAEIRTIRARADKTEIFDNEFIKGLWLGLYASTNQRRSRNKKSYELGRTCMFALIVKNAFEADVKLGPGALARDNFFFGNNEKERSDKNVPVRFHVKSKLGTAFNDPAIGQLIYGIVTSTASAVGFSYLIEREQDQVYKSHLIPVNDLITSCYPSITVNRKKKVEKIRKKPEKPRSSKLMSDGEMAFINAVSASIWTDLVDLQKDYLDQVWSLGFSEVSRKIRESIKVRWETLARFAHITKIRLQEIRKISNDPKIKKGTVLPEHLAAFIGALRDPAKNLVQEVLHIIGHQDVTALASYGFKKEFKDKKTCLAFLYNEALKIYLKEYPEVSSIAALNPWVFSPDQEPTDAEYERLIKLVIQTQNRLGNLQKTSVGLSKVLEHKLVGRLEALEVLFMGIMGSFQSLDLHRETDLDIALYVISNGKKTNSLLWKTEQLSECKTLANRILNGIRLRAHDQLMDVTKRHIDELLPKVRNFIDFVDKDLASKTRSATE